MNRATQLIKSDSKTVTIRNLKDIRNNPHEIYVLDDNSLEHEKIKYGEITAEAGQAAVKWILQAGELAAKNQIQAIVTAPINKESAKLAGYDDIGHQEIFQRQTNSQEVVTMLMTIFNQAIDGIYDVVIAMYHDQGHIPIKVYDWKHSVSVNLGLPFIRTSVDHGTAFNIAGQGIADPTSLLESIDVAKSLANKSILP